MTGQDTDEPASEPSITMTLAVAARRLGIGITKAREEAQAGRFPGAFRIGRRIWRVHRATFDAEVARMARGEALSSSDKVLERALDETRFRLNRGR